ncbi:MAG: GNAT family N-acetyltransferase [Pseudomonadota bacterium]
MSADPTVVLRPARPDEAAALTALSLRSKASWGYDAAFMAQCVAELTVRAGDLDPATCAVAAAAEGGGAVGLVQWTREGTDAVLLKLFVVPERFGQGIGHRLFAWAAEGARVAGAQRIAVAADPGAAPFYRRMGMRHAGTEPSLSIPGRLLPRLVLPLVPLG